MDYVDQIVTFLNKLYGLPAVALVFGTCIVFGYVLRFINKFPNNGIPVAVVLWGAIMMTLVADSRATSMSLRIWIVRNVLVGLIIGFLSWIFHKALLSRVEDWIASKWPDSGATTFFVKSRVPNPPEPPKPGV